MANPSGASESEHAGAGPGAAPVAAPAAIARALREHIALTQEFLAVVERENRSLQNPGTFAGDEFTQARKTLLPRLDESYKALKEARILKQQLGADSGEITALVRQAQDLALKIVMRDRENEQIMLRRGLLPAGPLPSAHRQRPHFVADLYRRTSQS